MQPERHDLPDAAQVDEARDALAREFAPATGYSWCGTDLARLSRNALIEALCTLSGDNWDTRGTRNELIYKLVLVGRREKIYDYHGHKNYPTGPSFSTSKG